MKSPLPREPDFLTIFFWLVAGGIAVVFVIQAVVFLGSGVPASCLVTKCIQIVPADN